MILALRAGCAVPVCSRQTGVKQQVLIRQGAINAKTAEMAVLTEYCDSITSGFTRAIHGARPAGVAVRRAKRQSCRLVEQQVLIRQGAINAKTAEMAVLTFMAHPSGSNLRPLPPEDVRTELK